MEKIKKWLPSKRKLMQLYFALLFNANLKGYVSGSIYKGNTKVFCAPGINCYSCPGAVAACPLGSLQGSFSAGKSTLFYVGGILLLYAILFGRMICGWLCPFGLIQELVYKIKTPKLKKSPVTRALSWLKYVILVFFVGIVPILYALRSVPLPAFCKYICPAGTIEGGLLLLSNAANADKFSMLGYLFTWKFLLMVSIILGCLFIFRLFCRFICPLGALYGLFNKISVFGIKLEKSKCVDCGLCQAKCKMDIRHVGDMECISCGECIDVCPTQAIVWKGPAIFLKANEGAPEKAKKSRFVTRCIAAIVMLGVLAGAFVYFWQDSPTITASQGTEVGDLCYGAQLQIVTADGLTENTLDPTKTGKLTVINFWGTWCSGCVAELPYFDRIAKEYADEVVVVAVHTAMLLDTAPAYIKENYPASNIIFASDFANPANPLADEYYTNLGGRDSYPYTVVIDENGVIVAKFVASVTYEELLEVVKGHLGA